MDSIKNTTKKNFPLRATLVTLFVLQIITTVGLVGYFSFHNGQQSVEDLAGRLIQEKSTRIKQHVLDYFNKPQLIVQMTHAALQSSNLYLDDFDGLRNYFWQVVHQEKLDNYVYLGTEKGEFIGVERRDDGTTRFKQRTQNTAPKREVYLLDDKGNPQSFLKASNYDPRKRPWYKEAMKNSHTRWGPVYASFSRRNSSLEISPIRPILDANGEVTAVLSMNLSLVRITDFLQDLYISPQGQSFILETSGNLIASSTLSKPFKMMGDGRPNSIARKSRQIHRLLATDAPEPIVSETAKYLQNRFGGFNNIPMDRQPKITIDGEKYYIKVSPIQDGRGLDWLAVVVVPEKDFMEKIYENNRDTIALTLAALIVAIGLGALTARWISAPIVKITEASRSIAKGELDKHVNENLSIIELRSLAHSFNSMAIQVNESFINLEDKVKERTLELASANEQITDLNDQLKSENQRMRAELEITRIIQRMILPKAKELESILDLDIAGFMEPADEVGGDYYDVLQTDNMVTLGIGDVTGHGLESGILMLMTQTAVRTLQEMKETDPVKFLDTLNRTIYQNIQRMDTYKHLTLAIVNYAEGRATISGQHEEILIVRADGNVERVDTMDLGFPIGLDAEIADFVHHRVVQLEPGDGFVLYTDGITEAENIEGEQYNLDRLCTIIRQNWDSSVEDIKNSVIDDVNTFIGEQKVFDDITLLVCKRKAG